MGKIAYMSNGESATNFCELEKNPQSESNNYKCKRFLSMDQITVDVKYRQLESLLLFKQV